ncbi:unnamed protein product, partial [Rotaria sp. Silwood1]
YYNHRIVKWNRGASSGQVVAGGNGEGDRSDPLKYPLDVAIDKDGTMYISDYGNKRVQRWFRGGQSGRTIIENIPVLGVALDDERSLYVSDYGNHSVRKRRIGETIEQLIISGLGYSYYMFVDRNRSVYISEMATDRVIKLDDESTEISIVAGGTQGDELNQLSEPLSVFVDRLDTVYVSDRDNDRIMRWLRGAKPGSIIVGGHGHGSQSGQLNHPTDISFDLDRNLYVVDYGNHRVQKFVIDKSSC